VRLDPLCRRQLDSSARRPPDHVDLHGVVQDRSQHGVLGRRCARPSLASLDDWPAAVDLFEQAAELRPAPAVRARYNDAAHLLEAQVAVNAWHDAEATIPAVLAGADDIRSGRTSALLRRVVRQIERAQRTTPSILSDSAHELGRVLDVV
jgi:hypothetical protein